MRLSVRLAMTACSLAIAAVVVIIIGVTVSQKRHAAADTNPTPTPAPRGSAQGATGTTSTPRGGGTPFAPPAGIAATFRDKVVHLTSTTYTYAVGGADPANGQQIAIDTWVQTDLSGDITKLHARSTLPDGSFLQEVNEGDGQSTLALGPAYASLKPEHGNPCTPLTLSSKRPLMPLFVDPATLPQLGYHPTSDRPVSPPASGGTLAGTAPVASFNVDDTIGTFSRSGASDANGTVTYDLEVQNNGKMDATRAVTTDRQGHVISENWQAYGRISLYASTSLPASVFAPSVDAQEACRG